MKGLDVVARPLEGIANIHEEVGFNDAWGNSHSRGSTPGLRQKTARGDELGADRIERSPAFNPAVRFQYEAKSIAHEAPCVVSTINVHNG